MKHVNKACEISLPPVGSDIRSSAGMPAPDRTAPGKMPDAWLLDSESLLQELARVRERD